MLGLARAHALRGSHTRLRAIPVAQVSNRPYSTPVEPLSPRPRRACLYVPGSDERKLEKSLGSKADCVVYDLEDSVSVGRKSAARELVTKFLSADRLPAGERAVRINAVGTNLEEEDLRAILSAPHLDTVLVPKVQSAEHLHYVASRIARHASPGRAAGQERAIRVIAAIESARAIFELKEIATAAPSHVDALLFAAEDYCADVGLLRTASRREMLYPRSAIVTAARAYGLQAIDLVCIRYKDEKYLRDECHDGRELGFDGKQAIHPAQVDIIQSAFVPTETEIIRAAKIKHQMDMSEREGKGAFGLADVMIDAPVLKQAESVLLKARAAGLAIPDVAGS